MDFEAAIKAHTFWKVTLRWMINGQREVDADKLGSPTECELGKWIIGAGTEFRDLPAYQVLLAEHAEFHRIAGRIARLIQEGKSSEATQMMAAGGPFALASAQTVEAIHQLRREATTPPEAG